MTKIYRGVRYPVSFRLNGEVVYGYAENRLLETQPSLLHLQFALHFQTRVPAFMPAALETAGQFPGGAALEQPLQTLASAEIDAADSALETNGTGGGIQHCPAPDCSLQQFQPVAALQILPVTDQGGQVGLQVHRIQGKENRFSPPGLGPSCTLQRIGLTFVIAKPA
jgi:hypothetical protein